MPRDSVQLAHLGFIKSHGVAVGAGGLDDEQPLPSVARVKEVAKAMRLGAPSVKIEIKRGLSTRRLDRLQLRLRTKAA